MSEVKPLVHRLSLHHISRPKPPRVSGIRLPDSNKHSPLEGNEIISPDEREADPSLRSVNENKALASLAVLLSCVALYSAIKNSNHAQDLINNALGKAYNKVLIYPDRSIREFFQPGSGRDLISDAEEAAHAAASAKIHAAFDLSTLPRECEEAVTLTNSKAFKDWLLALDIKFTPCQNINDPDLRNNISKYKNEGMQAAIKAGVNYFALKSLYYSEQSRNQRLKELFKRQDSGEFTENFEDFVKKNEIKFPKIQDIDFRNSNLFQAALEKYLEKHKTQLNDSDKLKVLGEFSSQLISAFEFFFIETAKDKEAR